MKLGQEIWAVVEKATGEIVDHPEGYMISEYRDSLNIDIKAWAPITKLDRSQVEIRKVKIVEVGD